jgi:hypothetical protein
MILAAGCNPENADEIPNPQFPNKSQNPKLQLSNRALNARFSGSAIYISGYRGL